MGIEDDFYASIKLKTGEEILTKVAASEEEDRTLLILSNPLIVEEIKIRGKMSGYKFEPWMKTTSEDMFIININDVLTMTENTDIEMICTYQDFIRRLHKSNNSELSREMGYITTVTNAKKVLEKIYNNS